jgi:hypothetical protein
MIFVAFVSGVCSFIQQNQSRIDQLHILIPLTGILDGGFRALAHTDSSSRSRVKCLLSYQMSVLLSCKPDKILAYCPLIC